MHTTQPPPQHPAPESTAATLHWQTTQTPTRFVDVLSGVALTACIYAALLLAMSLLTLVIVTPVVLLRGEDWFQIASSWLDAELWWLGLGIVVTMALVPIPFIFLFRNVEAFCFDSHAQQLSTVERRAWFQPATRQHRFDRIHTITPTLSNGDGSLEVALRKPNGKLHTLSLGTGLSEAQLQTQALWLRTQFADRVQPLYESTSD